MQNAHFIVSRAILSSTKDTFRRCLNLSTKHLFTTPYLVHKIRISRHTRIDLFNRNFSSSGPKSITDSPVEKINAKVVPKIKTSFSYDDSVKSVKYITPLRALREYMLTKHDLDQLPRYYSRSPYGNETKTLVFLRSDVEQMAYAKHGGHDDFELRRKLMKDMERRTKTEIFNLRKALKYLQNSAEAKATGTSVFMDKRKSLFTSGPGRVVLFAIAMYGYIPMRNVSSLISGVAIFFLGAGLTFYHSVQGILAPHEFESVNLALMVMLGSLLSEGSTLALAYREAKRSSKRQNFYSVRHWLFSGVDPSTSMVLLEDLAAVIGVVVAGSAMAVTAFTGHVLPDAIGGICVSAILATVAGLIIHTNTEMLIGRAIPVENQEAIMRVMDNIKIIRGTYDIKTTMIGGEEIRFKAEVDIDGRELTKRYLETLSLDDLLQEVKNVKTEQQLAHFMLKHGDNLVNTLGAEINKIEEKIKVIHLFIQFSII
ncbi:solute carrier family 30 (zinc transporter), member 9 [Schistosoma bovis]|uniref:Solute carrier family 30 (Zinc transporter), member 9 n=1 Tax=Schistosoma bovis TaxID=6184 RepID=A0A430Q9M3_SCHBO|nr:solute carrier family 30 (zinc transporter), member 9 [Schistosoma bovis]